MIVTCYAYSNDGLHLYENKVMRYEIKSPMCRFSVIPGPIRHQVLVLLRTAPTHSVTEKVIISLTATANMTALDETKIGSTTFLQASFLVLRHCRYVFSLSCKFILQSLSRMAL